MLAHQGGILRHHAGIVRARPDRTPDGTMGAALRGTAADEELGEIGGRGGGHVQHPRLASAYGRAATPVQHDAPPRLFRILADFLIVADRRRRRILRRPQLQGRAHETSRHGLLGLFEVRVGAGPQCHVHPAPGAHAARVAEGVATGLASTTEHGAHRHAPHRHAHSGKGRDIDPGLRLGRCDFLRGMAHLGAGQKRKCGGCQDMCGAVR